MVVSRLKSAKERAKGSSAGVKFPALTATRQSAGDGTVGDGGLTIVDDDTGDAEHLLHLGKGIDHIVGLGEVARDVQLVVGAVGLLQGAGGEGDLVALGGKGAGDGLADIGARAEDEDDGGFGGHDLMLGRLRISYLGVFRTWSCLKRGRSQAQVPKPSGRYI